MEKLSIKAAVSLINVVQSDIEQQLASIESDSPWEMWDVHDLQNWQSMHNSLEKVAITMNKLKDNEPKKLTSEQMKDLTFIAFHFFNLGMKETDSKKLKELNRYAQLLTDIYNHQIVNG